MFMAPGSNYHIIVAASLHVREISDNLVKNSQYVFIFRKSAFHLPFNAKIEELP